MGAGRAFGAAGVLARRWRGQGSAGGGLVACLPQAWSWPRLHARGREAACRKRKRAGGADVGLTGSHARPGRSEVHARVHAIRPSRHMASRRATTRGRERSCPEIACSTTLDESRRACHGGGARGARDDADGAQESLAAHPSRAIQCMASRSSTSLKRMK